MHRLKRLFNRARLDRRTQHPARLPRRRSGAGKGIRVTLWRNGSVCPLPQLPHDVQALDAPELLVRAHEFGSMHGCGCDMIRSAGSPSARALDCARTAITGVMGIARSARDAMRSFRNSRTPTPGSRRATGIAISHKLMSLQASVPSAVRHCEGKEGGAASAARRSRAERRAGRAGPTA